jgi:selenocysteine lyase/cysteine desulfurase
VRVRALPDGRLDEDDLDHQLAAYAGRVALLVVSGASNVTGLLQPVHRLAEKVHAVGGQILVDAAQLAAHRPIDMRPHDDPGHLDYVALSAHKMYAPFGTGALIGRRDGFGPTPDHSGGGTIHAVTVDDVVWAPLPDREEAGTPNVIGAVALAAAILELESIGLERIAAHEAQLTAYANRLLQQVPGLTLHGPVVADIGAKVGVIPFTVAGIDHGLVAAVLGYEHGVGVRSGCFCAQPYVIHLLGVTKDHERRWMAQARAGDISGTPGLVRFSLGCYTTAADIGRAVEALHQLVAGQVEGFYRPRGDGTYEPTGYTEPSRFSLATPSSGNGAGPGAPAGPGGDGAPGGNGHRRLQPVR